MIEEIINSIKSGLLPEFPDNRVFFDLGKLFIEIKDVKGYYYKIDIDESEFFRSYYPEFTDRFIIKIKSEFNWLILRGPYVTVPI